MPTSPDVAVVPADWSAAQGGTHKLEQYSAGLPFVAEVWSPSTGVYDIDTKLRDYLARGDEVVWRVHPYEKTVRAWTRQGGRRVHGVGAQRRRGADRVAAGSRHRSGGALQLRPVAGPLLRR